MTQPWHLITLALIFLVAGIFHFLRPKAFMRVMPRYLPAHKLLVYISGGLEILAGIGLLFELTQRLAALLIIGMLIAFLPVHIYMIANKKAGLNLPRWVLYVRLVLQWFLIFWAYQYF
ncbi:MauE/DoxX family redox-associated membrane protein [Flavobacteriaceae bacterium M23B6Z8]